MILSWYSQLPNYNMWFDFETMFNQVAKCIGHFNKVRNCYMNFFCCMHTLEAICSYLSLSIYIYIYNIFKSSFKILINCLEWFISINQLGIILNIIILHNNHKNRFNPTSWDWTLFYLHSIVKYFHTRFCLGLVLLNLSLILVNIRLV